MHRNGRNNLSGLIRPGGKPIKKIATKFILLVTLLAGLFVAVDVYHSYSVTRQEVLEEMNSKAALTLAFDLAIREYVKEEIRPAMEKRTESGEFHPETMSTSFVARNIFKKVRRDFPDYTIKFSSDNPRNPANQAGPDEMRMIRYFNENPDVQTWSGQIDINGHSHLARFSARRMKESCLRCHGNPDDAPASLVERYGSKAGFNRPLGEVVALDTVAIPLDKTEAAVMAGITRHTLFMVIGIALLIAILVLMFQFIVSRRLSRMKAHFEQIATESTTANMRPIDVRGNDEISALARSFNTMIGRLHESQTSLEQRVKDQTENLREANEKLQKEAAERKQAQKKAVRAHDKLKNILSRSPFGVVVIGRDRKIRWANKYACELAGVEDAERLCGRECGEYLCPADQNECPILDKNQELDNSERILLRHDGRKIPILKTVIETELGGEPVLLESFIDITERKLAEDKIRRSEAKFRDMVSLMPQSYAEFDLDGNYNYVNKVGLEMFGYEEKDYKCGVNIMDVIAPEDHDKVRANIKERLNGRTHTPNEYTMVRKDGSRFPALAYSTPIMQDGKPVGLRSVIVDITDRKRAEQERKRLLQRLQAIMDNVPAYMFLKDRRGRYTAVNKAYMQFLPPEVTDPIGGHDSDFFPPRLANKFDREDREVMEESHVVTKSEPIPLRDGQTIHAAVRMAPVRNDRGRITGMVGVAMDITKRKRAEEKLAAERRFINTALDNLHDIFYVFDRDGRYLRWNDAIKQISGYTDEMMRKAHPLDFFHKDDVPSVKEAIAEVWRKDSARVEARFRTKGGYRPYELNGRLLRDPDGRPIAVCGTGRDIGDLKQAEQQSIRAKEQAEAANKTKSEFLANMSHEIRTPMTAILGFTEQLWDPELSPSDRDNYLTVIHRNGEHLLDLINDVLDLSKIEAGRMTVEKTPTSIPSILSDVASMMRIRAEEKGITFSVEYAGQLPETIETDPSRLRQAMVNLAGNAVKFTEEGSVKIVAEFLPDVFNGNPGIRLKVADTGIGIPEDKLETLFDSFVQADASTSRKYGGTGLGLAITNHIAELLGGELTASSTEGEGSTFTLTLPTGPLDGVEMLDEPAEAVNGDGEGYHGTTAATKTLEGVRVLLAEDGPDNQLLIKTVLKKAGAQVEIVENGREAVEKAEQSAPFDVVLMDMQMPEMDGYQAARKLRRRRYRLPILALTAHAMAADRKKSIDAGCDDHISKPVKRAELIEAILRNLSQSNNIKESATDKGFTSDDENTSDKNAENAPIRSEFADDPDMSEIIDQFVSGLPQRINDMEDALKHNDYKTLRRCAHQTKGAGGSYGYTCLTEQAKELEQAAKASDAEASRLQLNKLKNLCRRVISGHECEVTSRRNEA